MKKINYHRCARLIVTLWNRFVGLDLERKNAIEMLALWIVFFDRIMYFSSSSEANTSLLDSESTYLIPVTAEVEASPPRPVLLSNAMPDSLMDQQNRPIRAMDTGGKSRVAAKFQVSPQGARQAAAVAVPPLADAKPRDSNTRQRKR